MKEPKTAFAYFQQDFIARFRHILKECTNYWIPVQRTWLELVSKWQKCRLRDSGRGPNGILASGLFFRLNFYLKIALRSQSNSMHVMKEVYRALHELGFLWRNISFFRIRVKMDSKRNPGRHEKMNITLYRSPRCSERSPGILRKIKSVKISLRLPAGLFILPDGKRARAVWR